MRLGFIFILTSQRENGGLQQPVIWERFFNTSQDRSQFVAAVVNWPFGVPLPSYVDISIGHETDYGGPRYVETVLSTANLLIHQYNVTGVLVLSGSCLPLQSFPKLFHHVSPVLINRGSILPERSTNATNHMLRYRQLKRPRIELSEFKVHQAQGYCLHHSIFQVLIENWGRFKSQIKGVSSLDEHYISLIFRMMIMDNQSSKEVSLAKEILQSFVKKSLMFDQWGKERNERPKTWDKEISNDLFQRLRRNNFFFMRKVASTCNVTLSL